MSALEATVRQHLSTRADLLSRLSSVSASSSPARGLLSAVPAGPLAVFRRASASADSDAAVTVSAALADISGVAEEIAGSAVDHLDGGRIEGVGKKSDDENLNSEQPGA